MEYDEKKKHRREKIKNKSKQESKPVRDHSNPSVRISEWTWWNCISIGEIDRSMAGNGRKRDKMIAKSRYARKIHIREEWERINPRVQKKVQNYRNKFGRSDIEADKKWKGGMVAIWRNCGLQTHTNAFFFPTLNAILKQKMEIFPSLTQFSIHHTYVNGRLAGNRTPCRNH